MGVDLHGLLDLGQAWLDLAHAYEGFAHLDQELGVVVVERQGFTHKTIAGGEKYDNNFDTDIILLQIQSGVAIDLSMSNTYIYYSWDFSHINHEQSKFRVMAFDSDRVNYYYLMAMGTVDEDIYEAVTRKRNLAKLVCDRHRRKNRGKKPKDQKSVRRY